MLDAVAELEALAVSERIGERISEFLSRDDTVVARMAAAVDLAEAAGLDVGAVRRAGRHLPRAARWQRYSRGPGQRSAPRLRRGHRQGFAAAVVADLRVPARAARGVVVSEKAGDDPAAEVDAMVAAIGPQLDAPAISRRDVVLVTGPWMAGVSGVVAALRERLPQHKFVESTDLGPGDAPTAVVFVVSAAAQLTESDCALLDAAAEHTDVVIGVVSKIDVHRNWRDVLAANRDCWPRTRRATARCPG